YFFNQQTNMNTHWKYIAMALLMGNMSCTTKMKEEKETGTTTEEPLNIILMIGDGMGVPQVSTAYYFGNGTPNFSRFKHIGLHKTSDKSHRITDSAAGATAFA